MAAMASFSDVFYLQDSVCLSCKDFKRQRRLRYSMVSALLAMVETLGALHSLLIALLPFALLWWKVLLHAVCAKYYAWNHSWLWLQQTAGQIICADIVQESCAASETSMAEEGEVCGRSSHQRRSDDDGRHITSFGEMSIVSLCRTGAYAEADAHAEKGACGLTLHLGRKLPQDFGVFVSFFPHQQLLHALNQAGDAVAVCLKELCPPCLEEKVPACETTPHSSKAQALSSSSYTSKLPSLCFLEERGPQMSWFMKDCHRAVCFLLRPLVVNDIYPLPSVPISAELSRLQIIIDRNHDLLHFDQYKGSMCVDRVSINWSIVKKGLQFLNGRCVLGSNQGKKFSNVEWDVTEVSTSRPISNNSYIIPSYGMIEYTKLCVAAQWFLSDLAGFQAQNGNTYTENGSSGLDSSEDTGRASCSSIKSNGEYEGAYCTSTESSTDTNDGLDYLEMLYGTHGHRDEDSCYKCCFRVNETDNIVYPAMDIDDSFYDGCAGCNVAYVGSLCGVDLDGFYSADYHADESGYTNCVDVLHIYEYGAYESPVEIYAGDSHTWWDKDAVILDVKEIEEEKIEEEWQVL